MTLKEALISSGNCDNEREAERVIKSMVDDMTHGTDPESLLEGYGLEPDYVIDLINAAL